ncbi:MAG: type I DNA topoisomerase [Parachlamydiales bacterium]|nr:type I DNA topoisomerase [Parachlamydiales bacterium]
MGKQKALVIVESPAKIKTLKKFLGSEYLITSSIGHIRDLPKKEFGIDVEHDFTPKYVNLPEKKEVIQKLKTQAKSTDLVYLAPDPDREGEAIAWHIQSILPKGTKTKRVSFHSLTKSAVLQAFKHPTDINIDLVNAQQARRLLDRIVGYKISPILTRKIRKGKDGTSAGRVQSVALKFVVDREKEIEAFVPTEYWNIWAILTAKERQTPFEAVLHMVDGEKVDKIPKKGIFHIANEQVAKALLHKIEQSIFQVKSVEQKEKKRSPVPPFITSTLQQEASRHYGYNVARTMTIAQTLYEGIDMKKEGVEGLITYMRTDSVKIAPEAIYAARDYIEKEYGADYLPEKPRYYTSKKVAQEAHEAIRPTNLNHPPETVKQYLTADQFKIYQLIWKRFISSQMKDALYDTISAEIETNTSLTLKASGSRIKFSGFLAVYEEKKDEEEENQEESILPPFEPGDTLFLEKAHTQQSFTKPPPRFSEASLVKELEKSGIGRPSTYASIMQKIQSRSYTNKENKVLHPTELGKIIAQMLEENFPPIMHVGFTAAMEDDLELVAQNKRNWKELIREFYQEFIPMVKKAEKEAVVPKINTKIPCPKCGHPLQKIWSKNKYFYGCSHYPDCDYTTPIEALDFHKEDYDPDFDWDQKCPKCSSPMVIRHGKFGPFLGCSKYPDCQGIVNIPKKGEVSLKPEERPDCPALGCDGKILMRRSRFGKIFYSCSNFPDCDVIVNNLEDLEKKYDEHHPKTPYQKKGSWKGKGKGYKYQLSEELAQITKEKELSRGEVIKKVWEYIKTHELQNPKNKREIIPDEKLSKVFGNKDPIDMMQLSKILGKHFKK